AESATVVDVKPAQASAEPDNRVEGDSQSASLPDPGDWDRLFGELDLSGVTRALASNCVMGSIDDEQVVLLLREQHASLWNASHEARIAQALTKRLGREMRLTIEIRDTDGETPAQAQERRDDEERAKAIDAISNDGNVKQIIEAFDGKLNMGSIMPRSQAER
ncbi:MAG: hypothetical protein KDI19_01295, partial [Pseudomonadales bacterium]|nr:hypothetical protein [Pseudomonadales bacterium]